MNTLPAFGAAGLRVGLRRVRESGDPIAHVCDLEVQQFFDDEIDSEGVSDADALILDWNPNLAARLQLAILEFAG